MIDPNTYAVMEGIEGANEEYCHELVLGFHQDTEAFQNLTPEEQSQYSQIAINEQNGNQDSKGTVCNE